MVYLSNISPRVLGHVNVFFSALFYKFLARSQWGRVFVVLVEFQVCFLTLVAAFQLWAGGFTTMVLVLWLGPLKPPILTARYISCLPSWRAKKPCHHSAMGQEPCHPYVCPPSH